MASKWMDGEFGAVVLFAEVGDGEPLEAGPEAGVGRGDGQCVRGRGRREDDRSLALAARWMRVGGGER